MCKKLDFSPKQYFAVLLFKVSAWLSNHVAFEIGLKYWRVLGLNNWWISPLTLHRFYAPTPQ